MARVLHANRRVIARLLLVVTLGMASCQATDNVPRSTLDGDSATFTAEVQPVLARHCAYLACHGREGMALTIYAVDFLRLRDPEGLIDPSRPRLDERALSGAENQHNRRSMAARVDDADPLQTGLLRRLIPLSKGGISHADTVVFESKEDSELQVIARWLETVSR